MSCEHFGGREEDCPNPGCFVWPRRGSTIGGMAFPHEDDEHDDPPPQVEIEQPIQKRNPLYKIVLTAEDQKWLKAIGAKW